MRLISCYIDGFGKLNNMEVQFEDGINTFVQDNGWGKSTLAAFIRVMLYGFDGETKRNDIENERKDIARGRGLPMAENWYLRAGAETTGFRGHLARRRAMTNA